MSIKIKLTLLLVILSCIPISFYGLLSLSNFERALKNDLVKQIEISSALYEQNLADQLSENQDLLNSLLNTPNISSVFSSSDSAAIFELKSRVRDQLGNLPDSSKISLVNSSSKILLSSEDSALDEEFYNLEIVKHGLIKNNLAHLAKNDEGRESLFIFGPVKEGDRTLGLIIIEQPIHYFSSLFSQRFGLGESGELIIFDKLSLDQEIVIFNSKNNILFEDEIAQLLNSIEIGRVVEKNDLQGKKYFYLLKNVEETNLIFLLKINQLEALAPVETLTKSLVSLLIISVFFVSVLAYLSAKNLSDPIHKLALFTKLAAKNKTLGLIEIESNDELGELGQSFNLMSAQLTDFYNNLESRVAERTKELESNKKAMLNLMEDLSLEKEYSDSQAHELLKFKQAVEAASDQIVISDPEGIVVYANNQVEVLTGYSIKEALGKKAGKLWGGLMPKEYFARMWRTIKVEKKVFVDEIINQRKNGEQYVALIKISPVLDKNGQILFFVGIERDITREKEIDRAKTEFVSLASHQLRTPLSIIRWYVDSLIQGKGGATLPEGKTLEYLKAIEESNIRMISLVGALLNVSRLELGTFSVDPKPTNLTHLVDAVIKEFQPLISEKNLRVNLSCAKELPVIALDENLTLIILQNLVSNAIKYTPESGQITLGAELESQQLKLTVADTGYGIPANQAQNIFTKLFRADNVRKKDVVGTGLGLYLVKSILDQVGGKITFESKLDQGTTFTVLLPISGMRAKEGSKQLEWNESEFIK